MQKKYTNEGRQRNKSRTTTNEGKQRNKSRPTTHIRLQVCHSPHPKERRSKKAKKERKKIVQDNEL